MESKVYFIRNISPENLIEMYEILGVKLKGKVGVKISTEEMGGNNYLHPELIGSLVKKVNGDIIECNTAYAGKRNTTKDHKETIEAHGFNRIATVKILDEFGEISLPVKVFNHLDHNIVGKDIQNYNSILMLSHFKGHIMAGYGGALKNMSIGLGSSNGKAFMHSAGKTANPNEVWDVKVKQEDFLESMAEACESVMDFMGRENIVYINVMNNLSIDCDCDSNPETPCMKDIGILSSLDPVALDRACLDLIHSSKDPGRDHFLERVSSRNGEYILPYANKLGLGNLDYELIEIK